MGFARKYILNVTNYQSYGIGANAVTTAYNLVNAFSGVTDTGSGTTYSYSAITHGYLGSMSVSDYNQRVSDLLSFAGIDTTNQRGILQTGAIVDDPSCPAFPCQLNSNFLIYRFLTGVRIVNIGTTYGTAEYAVYTGSSSGVTWSSIATFLTLDPTVTYTAAVRDNLSGEIICEYTKTFIWNNLIPSTTTLPPTTAPTTAPPTTAPPTTVPTTAPPTTAPPLTGLIEQIGPINVNGQGTLKISGVGGTGFYQVHMWSVPSYFYSATIGYPAATWGATNAGADYASPVTSVITSNGAPPGTVYSQVRITEYTNGTYLTPTGRVTYGKYYLNNFSGAIYLTYPPQEWQATQWF